MIQTIVAPDKAISLNQAARKLNLALLALETFDLSHAGQGPLHEAAARERQALLYAAADRLWCYVVQREACAPLDLDFVFREYRVPPEVQAKMGARLPGT